MKLLNKIINKILLLFKDEVLPPEYHFKREQINRIRLQYKFKILIETGTFFGETVEYFKNVFDRVYSIELSEELADQAKEKFINDQNVCIIHGDSGEVLKNLIVSINEPILFWLDGHYSSEFLVGGKYIKTAKGKKDTPIKEEIEAVLQSKFDHVILIDDARLFLGIDDYPSISSIKRLVWKNRKNYITTVEHDIIYIKPNKKD